MDDEQVSASSREDGGSVCAVDEEHAAGLAEAARRQSKRSSRSLSHTQRRIRHLVIQANKFPNGPEARELAEMEPSMPEGLREKIAKGGDFALWEEGFEWLAAELRRKLKKGTRLYPKRVLEQWLKAYPGLRMNPEETDWLAAWVAYLGNFKSQLTAGGRYAPGENILGAFGVMEDILESIAALDPPPVERSSAEERRTSAVLHQEARPSQDDCVSPRDQVPERQEPDIAGPDHNLPQTPREMPFRFTEFSTAQAKDFWRKYWRSDDIEELLDAGRALALDQKARNELEKHGPKAAQFFHETMEKLGIPLS